MVRPALSATRGLDIVDFLATFPARGFTLSEIMRATGINAASCHAILHALEARGYVGRRAGGRQFTLGPVLAAVGDAAVRAQPLIARAQDAALELARDLDVPVLLSAVIGDEIVGILSIADSLGRGPGLKTAERRPFVPPIGAPFLAWEDEAAIAGWLDRAPPAVSDAFLTDQHRNLALIRERGFQVALRSPGSPRLAPEFGEGAGYAAGYKDRMLGMAGALREIPLPETIEPDTLYDVILIAAPVFDAEGRCAFSLCLGDFTGRLDGGTILAHAERLVAACLAVMQADRG